MAIETPNFDFACGFFDGMDPPTTPNGSPVINQRGFQAVNPLTTPGNPLGGFTRIATSQYSLRTQIPIDFTEACAQVSCFPGKPSPNFCIGVGAPEEGDVQVVGDGFNDALFYVNIFHVLYDSTGGQSL